MCSTVVATESDINGSLLNTTELEDKDIVTSHQQQALPNENDDSINSVPSFTKDGSQESSVETSKRRSVIFSPDTKELLDNEDVSRQSLSTSQTIKDAKEILKKSNSGYSGSFTTDSDRSDNEMLSSSSADVAILESRVSQLESGLITEHTKPESKDDQSTSKLLDNHNSSKQADISKRPKTSTDSSSTSSSSSSSSSGSQSEVDHSRTPNDQKLLNDQRDHRPSVNALSDNDQSSTSQLSQPNQCSSHSLDASKPLAGSHSTIAVDHDRQSSKDGHSTPSEMKETDQTNNQQYENINHSDQDKDQANNQQSQNNDQSEQQDTKLDGQANQHKETNLSDDQGTDLHNDEKPLQSSESATLDSAEQDYNAS